MQRVLAFLALCTDLVEELVDVYALFSVISNTRMD